MIALTLGDPLGIGPEITVKALGDARVGGLAEYVVFGSAMVLEAAARAAGAGEGWRACVGRLEPCGVDEPGLVRLSAARPARPTAEGGEASHRWVEAAIAAAKRTAGESGRVDAIVTAPISKTSWHLAGHTGHPGHTELLAERFGAPRHGMLFVGPRLRVILVTVHIPVSRVPGAITMRAVLDSIELADRSCREMGVDRPRIAVCGLNPHAGEGGLLGSEDGAEIAPAISAARASGIDASGPWPADTVFRAAVDGRDGACGGAKYDCFVAMYHDQGLIPAKVVDGERSVNVTVGLPTIRTSPAHGTAFDIAGQNRASAESMVAAIVLAASMVERKRSSGCETAG